MMRLAKNSGRQSHHREAYGFTLIELMIVIVVVAILAAIAFPSYQESVRKSRRAEGRAALMKLMQQEEQYYAQHTAYIVFSSASTDANEQKFQWFSGNNPSSSSYEISATACVGDVIQNCVLLTAKPGTSNVNAAYVDGACGDLTMNSAGVKSATGSAGHCW